MKSKRILSVLIVVVMFLSMFSIRIMADSPQVTAVNASYDGMKTTTVSGSAAQNCSKVLIGILDDNGYQVAVDTANVVNGRFTKTINTGELNNNSTYTVKVCDTAGDTGYASKTFVAVNMYSVVITAGQGGKITQGTNNSYKVGSTITLSAYANNGYSFNKWTSSDGGVFDDENSASTTFTMPAGNVTITANFTIEGVEPTPTPIGEDDGEDGPIADPAPTPANPTNGPVKVEIQSLVLDTSTGNAKATVTETAVNKAFETSNIIVIDVEKVEGAKGYVTELPSKILAAKNSDKKISIKTEVGIVELQSNMLEESQVRNSSFVQIEIIPVDKSTLDGDIKSVIGDKTAIELYLNIDGVRVNWNNPETPVMVSIPYTPSKAELADSEHIVVLYIDSSGMVHSIPTGKYNAKTGMVTFKTTHFSTYSISFVKKSFDDITSFDWAKNEIEVLVSKGVISGTSEINYSPKLALKRADAVVLLVKALGLDAKAEDNFSDVDPSAYYAKAIGIAKKLGLISGVGNNKFNPEAAITRQDMMTLVAKFMKSQDLVLTAGMPSDLNGFADRNQVSDYALNSVSSLVKSGLVSGDGKKLNPLKNITRAEMAVLVYKVYNYQNK